MQFTEFNMYNATHVNMLKLIIQIIIKLLVFFKKCNPYVLFSTIFCVPQGKRLMTTFLLLKVGHQKKMHCQFSKLLGNYYSYMTEEIKW